MQRPISHLNIAYHFCLPLYIIIHDVFHVSLIKKIQLINLISLIGIMYRWNRRETFMQNQNAFQTRERWCFERKISCTLKFNASSTLHRNLPTKERCYGRSLSFFNFFQDCDKTKQSSRKMTKFRRGGLQYLLITFQVSLFKFYS